MHQPPACRLRRPAGATTSESQMSIVPRQHVDCVLPLCKMMALCTHRNRAAVV